jgi:hypothetical protein
MARTTLTVQQLTGPFPASPFNLDALTFAAADVSNENDFPFTGDEIIIVENTDATTARLVTLTAAPDPQKRSTDVTKSIAAGEFAIFEASSLTGWLQSDGKFWLKGDNAALMFAVVRLKRG